MGMTTWHELLSEAMTERGDRGGVIAYAPDAATFDIPFDDYSGRADGEPVLAWTSQYVYFPVVYDGSEWLKSAPRNPTKAGQKHVGGGG